MKNQGLLALAQLILPSEILSNFEVVRVEEEASLIRIYLDEDVYKRQGYRIPEKSVLLSTGNAKQKADTLEAARMLQKKGYKMCIRDSFVIVACGTSWHAGLIGKQLIESVCRIPVEVEYASEFRYRDPVIHEDLSLIHISLFR